MPELKSIRNKVSGCLFRETLLNAMRTIRSLDFGFHPLKNLSISSVSKRKDLNAAYSCLDDEASTSGSSGQIDVFDKATSPLRSGSSTPEHIVCLERSYFATAAVGKVECNSKGCRPIQDDSLECDLHAESEIGGERWGSRSRRNLRAIEEDHFSKVVPGSLDEYVWKDVAQATNWFEAALLFSPHDAHLLHVYARFSWKEMKDYEKADSLFQRALQEAPGDAEVLASYALFLWENESQ